MYTVLWVLASLSIYVTTINCPITPNTRVLFLRPHLLPPPPRWPPGLFSVLTVWSFPEWFMHLDLWGLASFTWHDFEVLHAALRGRALFFFFAVVFRGMLGYPLTSGGHLGCWWVELLCTLVYRTLYGRQCLFPWDKYTAVALRGHTAVTLYEIIKLFFSKALRKRAFVINEKVGNEVDYTA